MRWVRNAAIRPHRCAAIPFINQDPKGFIDTGNDLAGWDNHVYLSVTAVEQMARMIGWQPASSYVAASKEKAEVEKKLDEAYDEIAQLEKKLDAVEILTKDRKVAA